MAQHQVSDTLTWGGLWSPTENTLDPTLPNLATMLRPRRLPGSLPGQMAPEQGSHRREQPVWCRRRHLPASRGGCLPDAGEDIKTINFGGGYANHDARYIQEGGRVPAPRRRAATVLPRPFPGQSARRAVFPADLPVRLYGRRPRGTYRAAGNLGREPCRRNHKPTAQSQLLAAAAAGLGALPTRKQKHQYINFYGNLIRTIDREMGPVIDCFYNPDGSPTDLGRSTVIVRTADHGEMGLAHGGMRQKAFNTYEEIDADPPRLLEPRAVPAGARKPTAWPL